MKNLLDLDRSTLIDQLMAQGEKAFRAQQIFRAVYQRGVLSWYDMTEIAKHTREQLASQYEIGLPSVAETQYSQDGTYKWRIQVDEKNSIETVFIPELSRGTLCISSQAGCALACSFCATGYQGFNRNLTTAEMVAQIIIAEQALLSSATPSNFVHEPPIRNVVLMGMGEPLTNYDAVVRTLRILLDDYAYGLSRRRVTLSTSGIVPAIERLAVDCPVSLAVSLHAPNDALRNVLVPINQKYPLQALLSACMHYLQYAPRDFITFEYVMLRGVNDTPALAKELVNLIRDIPCKINLIPFNPFSASQYQTSTEVAIRTFADIVRQSGKIVTTRKTRGDDIAAACGQLVGRVQNRRRVTVPLHYQT